ncbi:MAG: hypothetical protein M0R17_10590 [Candidatus Omnitrophica bacterium]|jgi:hypothetical protein|nr:hypothetical protein [Candidatus Omnitrophota bacterium]
MNKSEIKNILRPLIKEVLEEKKNLPYYIKKTTGEDIDPSKLSTGQARKIFYAIVNDLNKGQKSDKDDSGYLIYKNGESTGIVTDEDFLKLRNAADTAYQYSSDRATFETKELANQAIKMMGKDFLNILFK